MISRPLRGRYPTWPNGGYQQTDVRDVATLHAAVMSAGAGPRRYIVPGHHVDGRSMFNTLELVTGRRLRHVILPVQVMLPLTWVATAAQRVLPIHLPAEYEGVLLHRYDTRYDDSPARKEFGLQPRPLVDPYRDTVRWLYQAGWFVRSSGRRHPESADRGRMTRAGHVPSDGTEPCRLVWVGPRTRR